MLTRSIIVSLMACALTGAHAVARQSLPATPITYGFFTAHFAADGAFTLKGDGWPAFAGTWKADAGVLDISTPGVAKCEAPGRYRYRVESGRVHVDVVADECTPRRMILDRSAWRPLGEPDALAERRITHRRAIPLPALPPAEAATGSWPSFRGPVAAGVADGQQLPDTWDPRTGENILWQTRIPGLGHSSPVVWGHRVFVTSAVSSRGRATFKPGLYGDGDASDDRSPHRFVLAAIDKRTGRIEWERVAFEGPPVDTRHIKSTYASATPATDGRTVVVSFGSQGLYAYDVNGTFRWKVDLGHVKVGAYDIPSYEWGPASSPILFEDLVILQVDTHLDSFLLALDASTGAVRWKTDRDELPSWGTPTVAQTAAGPELVTNGSKYVRGYDPRTGKELWRLGGSSKITAPTPIFSDGLFVVASGRAPERPIFVVKPGARGDLTLEDDNASNDSVVWSRTGRGSYMPTPLGYRGILYVLANNGVFDAYDLKTGTEIYRQRLPSVGSGYSASPVAADGRIYLSSEDGEMLVVSAGREFRHLATNAMGELLMATPALSDGVMFVRAADHLFAVGRKP
ncbi:MAG TPA: PQQ-binding-like beta-propeller repeat protein [Vicinamibacterales bacterium]|nr:PQQ-binding-like beta-propeller repeat protein [Vicinamibacterales bacterium]